MPRGNQASTPQKKKKGIQTLGFFQTMFASPGTLTWTRNVLCLGGGQGGKEGKGVDGLGGEGRERTGSRDTRFFRAEAPGWAGLQYRRLLHKPVSIHK